MWAKWDHPSPEISGEPPYCDEAGEQARQDAVRSAKERWSRMDLTPVGGDEYAVWP